MPEYLVSYVYGQGAVWAILDAPAVEEIESAYPELVVMDARPAWMDYPEYERIRERQRFNLAQPPSGFLLEIVKARKPPQT